MDVTALAAFAPIKKALDVYRYLVTGDEVQWREALTIIGSWVLGVCLVFLVINSSFADQTGIVVEGWADYVLYGITLGSLAGVLSDLSQPTGVTIR